MSKKKVKCYKVVRMTPSGLMRSAVVSGTSGDVVYNLRRVTKPNPGCGPLGAFKILEDAIAFSRPHNVILECLCKLSSGNYFYYPLPSKDVKVFDLPPVGSIYVDEITPMKVLDRSINIEPDQEEED